ncbi:Uncharacterized protein Fot_48648 [Forsythia ovata]|uniref:Uncharacterized protein n=1 Tax=Forsythia ovata TaxID=205694 RepID=A0ABD1QAU4_9LAMI
MNKKVAPRGIGELVRPEVTWGEIFRQRRFDFCVGQIFTEILWGSVLEDKPEESSPPPFQVSEQPKDLTVETLRTIPLKVTFHWRRLWEGFDIKAITGQQTRSGTRITATTAESESVARDDQLPLLPYVTYTQFNSLEIKIETLMAFLHNQTQKAAELAPNSSENHNGLSHLVEHRNAPPDVQPTRMGQGGPPVIEKGSQSTTSLYVSGSQLTALGSRQ